MQLQVVDERGVGVVEGTPDESFMSHVDDVNRVLEVCFAHRIGLALLYAANLTPAFFDLSSREAGGILQKLRNYGVRLAVVCPPGTVELSTRFAELLAEERRGRFFRVFETPTAARAWLVDLIE